jgi:hypothetical protein
MNTCGMQRAPLLVRKPKQTGVALRHAATRNVIIAETVGNNYRNDEKHNTINTNIIDNFL